MQQLNPAQYVIQRFGGVRPLARLLGISGAAVCQWQNSGKIPAKHHEKIIGLAKQQRIQVHPKHLILGGYASTKRKKGSK